MTKQEIILLELVQKERNELNDELWYIKTQRDESLNEWMITKSNMMAEIEDLKKKCSVLQKKIDGASHVLNMDATGEESEAGEHEESEADRMSAES